MSGQLSGVRPWRRFFRTTRVVQPAAGAGWSYQVPAGEIHKLVSVFATLATSIAAPTRVPLLTYGDGSVNYLQLPAQAAIAASLTTTLAWAPVGFGSNANNAQLQPLPDVDLQEGEQLQLITTNLDAADQWSAIFVRAIVTQWQGGRIDLGDLVAMPVVIVNPTE